MSHDWTTIAAIMFDRRRADALLIRKMIEVRDRYNGDIAISLPDVPEAPDLPPLMPQLIYDGIENTALRAASTMPIIECPPYSHTPEGRAEADLARKALYGRWYDNQMTLKIRRAYRHLTGYGTYAMVVMPERAKGRARVEVRDPLTSYPEMRSPDDIRCPMNVGFVFGRSSTWVHRHFPATREIVGRNTTETLWDMVEWVDEDDIVIGLLGPREQFLSATGSLEASGLGIEIHREPNRAGIVPAVVPRRITLDRIAGQMSAIVPMVDWSARLMALEVIAAERSVFPDTVVFSDNQAPALISDNTWKDGRTGEVNFVTNARDVRLMGSNPSPMTNEILDRLERAGRHAGGVSAQFSGEMTGSIRSGRVASSIAELSIDPRIQELQEIMAYGLAELNEAIARVERGYFPNRKMVVFSGWAGDEGTVEYVPSKAFEHYYSVVYYSMPGSDITQTNVGLSQMVAGGLMSKMSARRKHPYIDDASSEERRIVVEQVETAIIASAQQQIASGALPLIDAVALLEKLDSGDTLVEAIRASDEEARARQAAQPQPPPEGMAVPPETAPGLALPGQGAETIAPAAPIPPPEPGVDNLAQMFNALRAGARSPVPEPV